MRLGGLALLAAMPPKPCPVEELFAISDIHVDIEGNRRWIESLPPRPRDGLIVAGDVSHETESVRMAFRSLKEKYAEVYYCFGNHDVWDEKDSVAKICRLEEVAKEEGVRTRSAVFGAGGGRRVLVVPIKSWHHMSFDTEPAITQWQGIPSARYVISDYKRCKWPQPLRDSDESVAQYVDSLNDDMEAVGDQQHDDIVSFSHFLPRIELIPEKRYLYLPTLTKAVGSRFLGDRVQKLRPDLHCFGHTHIAWDATLDGIRYVQAALAYEHEWRTRPHSLKIGALSNDSESKSPVKIWDSVDGVVKNRYPTAWNDYYDNYPRTPTLTNVLPPYSAKLYRPLPGSEVKNVRDHVPPFSTKINC